MININIKEAVWIQYYRDIDFSPQINLFSLIEDDIEKFNFDEIRISSPHIDSFYSIRFILRTFDEVNKKQTIESFYMVKDAEQMLSDVMILKKLGKINVMTDELYFDSEMNFPKNNFTILFIKQ